MNRLRVPSRQVFSSPGQRKSFYRVGRAGRVSANNWVVVSSKQTTGRWGS